MSWNVRIPTDELTSFTFTPSFFFIFRRASEKTTRKNVLLMLFKDFPLGFGEMMGQNDDFPWRFASGKIPEAIPNANALPGPDPESPVPRKGPWPWGPPWGPQASWMVYMENPCMRTGGSPMTKRKPPFFVNSPQFFSINSWYKHV